MKKIYRVRYTALTGLMTKEEAEAIAKLHEGEVIIDEAEAHNQGVK